MSSAPHPVNDWPEHTSAKASARRSLPGDMFGVFRTMMARIPARDLLFLAALALLAFKVNWGLEHFRDIHIRDESSYLEHGRQWDLPSARMSPLYCVWYAGLLRVIPDAVTVYYANWILMTLALAAGVYLLARSLGAASLMAFLSAVVILLTRFYDVYPRPMHAAASLVMIGLAVAFSFSSTVRRISIATLTLGVASFVRPGFAVAFLVMVALFGGVIVWEIWKRPKSFRRLAAWAILAILPVAVLCGWLGFPLGGGRSEIAFSQHYSYSKFQAGLIETEGRADWIGPWHSYRDIIQEDFGVPEVGVSEALTTAPWKVAGHIGRSAGALVPNSAAILTGSTPVATALVWGYLVLMAIIVVPYTVTRTRTTPVRQLIGQAGWPLLIGLIVIAPVFAACLVIYPREHYLVCLLALSLAYITGFSRSLPGFSRWRGMTVLQDGPWRRRLIAVTAGLVILLAPSNFVHWDFEVFASSKQLAKRTRTHAHVAIAGFLREIPFQAPLRILESRPHSIFMFTNHDYQSFQPRHLEQGFADYLRQKRINVVILRSNNETFIGGLQSDHLYQTFQHDPPPGWVILEEPHGRLRLAVRRNTLARSLNQMELVAEAPQRGARH